MYARFAQFRSRDEFLTTLESDTPTITASTGVHGITSPPARRYHCYVIMMANS